MEKHSYDVEVGPEIVDSLARSLKDCRRQLKQSEKNAKELEKSNRILTESIEKLKQENSKPIYDLAGAHGSKSAIKVKQADITPKLEEAVNDVETTANHYTDLKEKYQKEKTKRRQAREQCDALTAQLVEVTGEGTALSKRIGELEDVLEKLRKKAIPSHANERKMLKDAMEQRPFERPQVQIGPIAKHKFTSTTFRKFLSSNPQLQGVASPNKSICLQYSDPFLWSGKPGGHALLFAPSHQLQLNAVEAKWISHPMKEIYGTTKELFIVNHDTTYYDGTYKCLPLSHEMKPGGCTDLSGLDLEALARVTISDNGASHQLYQDSFQRVMELWKFDILKAECIGLQYVGFDEGLYSVLVSMGRKLGHEALGNTRPRAEVRGNSHPTLKMSIGHDGNIGLSEYSGNNERRAKRRRE